MCNVTTLRKCLPFEWGMVREKELPELDTSMGLELMLEYCMLHMSGVFSAGALAFVLAILKNSLLSIFGHFSTVGKKCGC